METIFDIKTLPNEKKIRNNTNVKKCSNCGTMNNIKLITHEIILCVFCFILDYSIDCQNCCEKNNLIHESHVIACKKCQGIIFNLKRLNE